MNTVRLVPLVGALAIALTACTSGGPGSPASASPSTPPSVAPSPSDSAPPDTGVTDPGGGVPGDPGQGGAKQVSIWRNAQDPHDVVVTNIVPSVNGRRLAVQLEWMSGVEPCNVLAAIDVQRNGQAFQITVREGIGDPNAMCIEIAQLKATIVDLGELEPGTYTIMAKGEAPPVEVVIP